MPSKYLNPNYFSVIGFNQSHLVMGKTVNLYFREEK